MITERNFDYAMTEQEIADELGISRQNVDMTIRRAIRKLRAHPEVVQRLRDLAHARRSLENGRRL